MKNGHRVNEGVMFDGISRVIRGSDRIRDAGRKDEGQRDDRGIMSSIFRL